MFCKNCGQQVKVGSKFCKNCGQEIKLGRIAIFRAKFFEWLKDHHKGLLISLGIVIFIIIIGIYDKSSTTINTSSNYPAVQTVSYNQNEIAASVVNIFCPSTEPSEETSGGSGTIISEDGLILTNSHIVPQDKTYIHVDETGCLVVLPDPITGQPKDVYLARPIVLPDLSDKYDLAFMDIYSAYYDEEKGEYAGVYPRKFPSFDDTTRCKNENVQLGEPVRIFGYPVISGGYSLTITDGVVSSFPGDGLIVTSAKVSQGNSGGLAVDRNGCMIGVPSMVSSDEAESLGVIISMDLVNQFDEEVTTYINNLK
jgi:putative serine protease PepD